MQKSEIRPRINLIKKFGKLSREDICFDLHMHTNYTDAKDSIEDMVDNAITKGLKTIAITEHVNHNTIWYDRFLEKLKSKKELEKTKINLMSGIEARVKDMEGDIDASEYMIKNSEIVVASVHSYPSKDGFISLKNILNLGSEKALEMEFNFAKSILNNPSVDVLGHPFGVYSKLFESFPYNLFENLCEMSLNSKIAIEINTKYSPKDKTFFEILRKTNPYVSIGSDAHKKEDIAKDFNILKMEIENA